MKDIFNILAGGGGLLLATIPLEKVGVVYLDSLHKVNLYVKEKIKLYTLYIYIYIYIYQHYAIHSLQKGGYCN